MILLVARSLLGIAAVVDIAFHARPEPVAAKELAARQSLPQRYLETVLQQLVRAGILKGVRGPRGGYELARERRRISVGDVVRVADASSAGRGRAGPCQSQLVDAVVGPAIGRACEDFLAGARRRSRSRISAATPKPSRCSAARRPASISQSKDRRILAISTEAADYCQLTRDQRIRRRRPCDEHCTASRPRRAGACPGRGRIYNSITETIGDTPLVRLQPHGQGRGTSRPTSWPSWNSSIRSPASRTASASA